MYTVKLKTLIICTLISAIIGLVAGIFLFNKKPKVLYETEVVYKDTTFTLSPPEISVDIVDTVYWFIDGEVIKIKNDSLVALPISSKRYKTDKYDLQISGFQPKLDWIYTYETHHETTKVVETFEMWKHGIFLSGSLSWDSKFYSNVSVDYMYNIKYAMVGGGVGYDFINGSPTIKFNTIIPFKRWK